ncbi:muscle M-line assembly protein unc-89 isoform X9 [Octopus sinensis]|uniref:Muscle M-line assembly protein unc-89 isoform X9 n=1 Tax=Octopus sinensis TaxID=2607531 RepID=A0A7E6F9F7_9MOLL|nr:muscle M-line assembly protein unc-89 isoform X9 [Octopus sinensis]
MALSTAQIRTNLGKGILEGKRIRIDEDGFENFDDYFTETDSDDSDVEIVNHADNVKIVAVKPAADDDAKSSVSPLSLSNFPSRKRLSFPVESMTDSCSNASEEVSYVQRVISKRGMKSLADTSAADSEDGDHQEVIVSEKEVTTTKTPEVSSAVSNSNSNVRIISKRGMKSFPEDEESFVQKAASSPTKESLSTNVCDPSAEEPETTVKNGGNTSLSSSKECQENEDDEENEDDLENDNIKNEDVLPEAVSTRKKRKMTVSESFSASPEKIKESPRKMISAFGVHKPTVQTRYFDVFDTNLSLIEENEKTFKKSTKIVKKPESGGRSAEKNKDVPSDVPKDKSSPLRHKKPQPSPTAKQTLKSKSVPQEKSSPLKRKKPQPSPTAKHTLNYKRESVPQDKSSPSRYKKPPTTSPEKQTLRNKSEAKDKTPPSRHKRPQPPLAAKHTLKSKIPSGVLKEKSSPLRHKKLRPSPIAKSTLKTKSVPSDVPEDKPHRNDTKKLSRHRLRNIQ